MSRSARLTFLDQPHLISAKSSLSSKLFYTEEDFNFYIEILLELVRNRLIELFGFCLHAREVHLLLSPRLFSIGRVIQRLHGRHSLRINHVQNRQGSLFQSRFDSQIIYKKQLCEAIRNIHLWPVRKGFVRRAENYPWSSHLAYLNLQSPWSDFLNMQDILDNFSDSPSIAKRAFARYVESAALEPEETLESWEFNDPKKTTKNQNSISLNSLAKKVCLLLNTNTFLLRSSCRRQDLVMARRLFATAAVINTARTITEVANFLKRDKAQISRLVSQGMDLLHQDEPFKLLFQSI